MKKNSFADSEISSSEGSNSKFLKIPNTVTLEEDRMYFWRVRFIEFEITGIWGNKFVSSFDFVYQPPGE